MQTNPEQEELSPAMQVAVEALNSHVPGTGGGTRDAYYRGEKPMWLPRSREGEAVAQHQQTLAALNSLDSMKWGDR